MNTLSRLAVRAGLATLTALSPTTQALALEPGGAGTADTPPQVTVSNDGVLTVAASGKSFRAAPQNGANIIVVAYSCDVAAAGVVLRTHVSACEIRTDQGGFLSVPGIPTDGNVAQVTGTTRLTGNVATICVAGAARFSNGNLLTSPRTCSTLAAAV